MKYTEAIEQLEALGIMPTSMPQLAPMRRALRHVGLAERIDPHTNIIVAGTNGKGTTAATLSRLITSAGNKVGLYTSPHLVSTTERFRINEQDISEEQFVSAYQKLRPIIDAEGLTHFEALTLIAAELFFAMERVDYAIWEVGLGGLYDATNAIPHSFCAISRLGLDHQAILGQTLPEIACQKFGVIGKNAVVVSSPLDPSLSALRQEVITRQSCRWVDSKPVDLIGTNQLSTPWGPALMALPGARAVENTALALTLFEQMGFDASSALPCLEQVRWPGRFSPFGADRFACPAYLSGDHNLQGVESLIQILSQHSWQTLHLVVGIGRDKPVTEMLQRLCALPRVKLYLTETPFKPLYLEEYPAPFKSQAVLQNKNISVLLERVQREAGSADLIVVTGSLYLVGEISKRRSTAKSTA